MFATSREMYYVDEEEALTGRVFGEKASDIEERFARGLSKMRIPFAFRQRINPLYGLSGEKRNTAGEVEIDFLASDRGNTYAFQIQGEIAHFYFDAQKEIDRQKRVKINAFLKTAGARPLVNVPFWLLFSQTAADRLIRRGFASGWTIKLYLDGDILALPVEEQQEDTSPAGIYKKLKLEKQKQIAREGQWLPSNF